MRVAATVALACLLAVGPLAERGGTQEDAGDRMEEVEELLRRLKEAEGGGGLEELLVREGETVLRAHNVADLTVRLTRYVRPHMKLKPAGAEVSEDQPLFGKAEEGEIFFAGVDEIADLILQNVAPDEWEGDRARLDVSGSHTLIVVAEPAIQEAVGRYLASLRESVGSLVTVEVRLLETKDPPSGILTRAEGLRLVEAAEDRERVLLSARITGFNGQLVSLYRGVQQAFVQDYDVEGAQDAKISDPIVSVLQTGLSMDVRSMLRGEKLVVVDVRADLIEPGEEPRAVETVGGAVAAPVQRVRDVRTTVTVPDGGFAVVGAGRSPEGTPWTLLISPRRERMAGGAR